MLIAFLPNEESARKTQANPLQHLLFRRASTELSEPGRDGCILCLSGNLLIFIGYILFIS